MKKTKGLELSMHDLELSQILEGVEQDQENGEQVMKQDDSRNALLNIKEEPEINLKTIEQVSDGEYETR